jgi:ATP-binding cassette subfamily B protein
MIENNKVTKRQRWTKAWRYGVFSYSTLIEPWPPFLIFLGIGAVIGALTPLIQVWATGTLIDRLLDNMRGAVEASLLDVLAPYWGLLGLIVLAMFLRWMIYMASFQDYLAAQVNARVREGVERRILEKAISLRLEYLERPAYYRMLQRARQAVAPERVAQMVDAVQRAVAQVFGCIGLLWFFAGAHRAIALLLCLGSLPLIHWRIRSDREMIDINFNQTDRQRRRDYWRDLLVQRQSAAEVRLFGLGTHLVGQWRQLTDRMLAQVKAARWRNMRGGVGITVADLGLSGLMILGLMWAAAQGQLSAGTFVALVYALPQYFDLVFMISLRLEDLHRFFSEYRYVVEFWR